MAEDTHVSQTSEEPKKRGRKPAAQKTAEAAQVSASNDSGEVVAPAPRRRGRPRKNPLPEEATTAQAVQTAQVTTAEVSPAPKRRGRPRKNPLPEDTVVPATPKRRGRPRKNPLPEEATATASQPVSAAQTVTPEVAPAPRRRGRPRKNPLPEQAQAALPVSEIAAPKDNISTIVAPSEVPDPPKRKRGRPRKVQPIAEVPATVESSVSSNPSTEIQAAVKPEELFLHFDPLQLALSKQSKTEVSQVATTAASQETTEALGNFTVTTPQSIAASKESAASDPKHMPTPASDTHSEAPAPQRASKVRSKEDREDIRSKRPNKRSARRMKPAEPQLSMDELSTWKVAQLREKAAELGINATGIRKAELIELVYKTAAEKEGFRTVTGILEITSDGFGFIRSDGYMSGKHDSFVFQHIIKQYGLRPGDMVEATTIPARGNGQLPPVQIVSLINGLTPEESAKRPRFKNLTPVYPNEQLVMEHGKDSITGRAIDIVAPIGKGQRGLIVSPPKAGKTTILKKICESIAQNNPEVHLICLLVDERPEEVTDMRRSIKGEVVASTFDMPAENHTQVSELVIERAKRLVEQGKDVVVILDSITRLARAYNLAVPASGRILSGGVDSAALYPPKRFLGAARNIENGGSLTILASALIDTGSKMDEVIFEEFKGTGNMELKLDRELADKRIYPAIDPVASGTRNEDLLIDEWTRKFIWGLRRTLANINNVERAETMLIRGLKSTPDNHDFLIRTAKKAQHNEYSDL